MKVLKISAWVVFVIILSIVAFVVYSKTREVETIKFVTSAPMRGITLGEGIINGVKLALKDAGYKAGRFKIELVVRDDGDEDGRWIEALEKKIVEEAVADKDVMIYLGAANSGASKISIPITNKGGLSQISPSNTWPGLTRPGFAPGEPGIFYPTGVRNYFRVVPTDAIQGEVGAVWAKEMGVKSVFILDDGDVYGKGISDIFAKKAVDIDLSILGRKTVSPSGVTDVLDAVQKAGADLVYFGGVTPSGITEVVRGMKEREMKSRFMGPDGIVEQAFIDQSGDAAEGVYATIVGIPPDYLSGSGADFRARYMKEYGIEPEIFSVFGYEEAKVALLAVSRAGVKDRGKILEELSKIKNYDGVMGVWSFDRNGDTTLTTVSGYVIKNKAFIFKKAFGFNQ